MSGLDFIDYKFQMHKKGGTVVNFQAARLTTSGDPLYNAWISEDGSYVISEQNNANGTIKYFFRKSTDAAANFTTDWSNRANLTYVDYNALFS